MIIKFYKIVAIFLFCSVASLFYFQCKDDPTKSVESSSHIYLYSKSISFGYINPNSSRAGEIKFTSKENREVTISAVKITGINSDEFAIKDISTIVQGSRQSQTIPFIVRLADLVSINIQFTPKTEGKKTAILDIESNNGNKSTVELTGICNQSGIGFEYLNITINGKYKETLYGNIELKKDSIIIPFLKWSNDSFSYNEDFTSNSGFHSYKLSGKISADNKSIEFLNYENIFQGRDLSISSTYSSHNISFKIKYLPLESNFKRVTYKNLGLDAQKNITISYSKIINYPRETPPRYESIDYIPTAWNDSSYIQVEFY